MWAKKDLAERAPLDSTTGRAPMPGVAPSSRAKGAMTLRTNQPAIRRAGPLSTQAIHTDFFNAKTVSAAENSEMMRQTASERARDVGHDLVGTYGVAAGQKRVLCATDLSARSSRVVQRAAFLANRLDAKLTLLHVMAPDQRGDRSAHARRQMARQLPLTLLPAGSEPKVTLRTGDYVPTIAAVAKETKADLIILGSQPRKPLAPLIGLTAERVARLAGCPTLIVNIKPRMRYSAVVIAAEISDAFIRVARLAGSLRLLDAPAVSIVHGFESPYRGPMYSMGFHLHSAKRNIEEWEKAAGKRLRLTLDAAGVESSHFRLCFQQTKPLRAIQREIRRVQPELLIVGTKERAMLNRIVRGSVANDMLRTLECDILVAAPDAEASGALH
jgi:nucleotide-binding universal stress UspA family protein